jgi:hypothetical protein
LLSIEIIKYKRDAIKDRFSFIILINLSQGIIKAAYSVIIRDFEYDDIPPEFITT